MYIKDPLGVMLEERSVLLLEQRVPYDHMRKGH